MFSDCHLFTKFLRSLADPPTLPSVPTTFTSAVSIAYLLTVTLTVTLSRHPLNDLIMMSYTGNRGTTCWKGILFLVTVTMQLVYPVVSLEESFCAGTGYYNLNYGDKYSIRGYRTTGWDRLFAVDKPFTSFIWGVKAIPSETPNNPVEHIRFVRDVAGMTLNGWIYIAIDRQAFPFHYVAVWAINPRNEAYGTFLFNNRFTTSCASEANQIVYNKPYAYVPCSAGPANVDTVPNMFIYANMKRRESSNTLSFVEGQVVGGTTGEKKITLLWRSPPQTYCNRPEKFRFVFAYTPTKSWSTWAQKWDQVTRPVEGMYYHGFNSVGPIVHMSAWIVPNYYGHPSIHNQDATLGCGGYIDKESVGWVKNVTGERIDTKWFSGALYPKNSMSEEGKFTALDVVQRSTCKGENPVKTEVHGFGGRCSESNSASKRTYITASIASHFDCSDRNERVGAAIFMTSYKQYLDKFKNRMESGCECRILTADTTVTSKTQQAFTTNAFKSSSKRSFGGRSLSVAQGHAIKTKTSSKNKEIYQQLQDDTKYRVTSYKRDHDVCSTDHVNLSSEAIADKGGVCVQTPVGKLVYGVRQWHGLTSLGVSLVITPLSIFIARYHKGDMILEDCKVQIRPWYLVHILLVFPAIWMYASGITTMGRQTDVIGHSLTFAAKFHRMIGVVTISFIPLQVITGFLRPLNLMARRVVIFVHWLGGILQHILEITLCCTAFLIPASPTSSTSVFSSHFGKLHDSFESQLVLGWFGFSVVFHIFQTVRVKRRDRRNKFDSRSVFPVIIPQFSRFDEELILGVEEAEPVILADDVQDLWFERGSLLIFGLVSGIVFVVCVVSLYQELHENLYYGFGPMSCTHTDQGKFIPVSSDNKSDDKGHKMDNMCIS